MFEEIKKCIDENKFGIEFDNISDPKVIIFTVPVERIVEHKREGMVMLLGYFELYKDMAKAAVVSQLNKKESNKILTSIL